MFNIKNIVNKITERGRDSQPNSPGGVEDNLSNQGAEGFLCPKCMTAYPSPEELQAHYEELHNSVEANEAAVAGFGVLHQEAGLHLQRQAQAGQSVSNERLAAEIQGITSVIELQKSLMDALESKAQLQLEKESLEQRTAQLARVNAAMKSVNDEEQGKAVLLKERLKILEDQLSHRESIDDAAVLRQELVQVQRVMDEMTQERERERDELRGELQRLKTSYELLEQNPNSSERVDELLLSIKEMEVNNEQILKQSKELESLNLQEKDRNGLLLAENSLLKSNIAQLVADSKAADQAVMQAREQVQALSAEVTTSNQDAVASKKSLEEKNAEAEILSRELHVAKAQLEGLVSKVEELSLAETYTATVMHDKDERLAKLAEDLKRHASEGAGAAKAAVEQLAEENEARLREMDEAIGMLRAEKKKSDDAAEKAKKDTLQKETIIYELEKSLDGISEKIKVLETDISAKNQQLKSLQGTLEAEVAKNAALEECIIKEQAAGKLLADKLEVLSKDCKNMEEDKLQLDVSVAALETQLFEKEVLLAKNDEYTHDLRDELSTLTSSFELRGTTLASKQLELEAAQEKIEELSAAKLNVTMERDSAIERLAVNDALIDELNRMRDIKDQTIDTLKTEQKESEKKHLAEVKALEEKLSIQIDLVESYKKQLLDSESKMASELEAVKHEMTESSKRSEKEMSDLQGAFDVISGEVNELHRALDDVAGEKLVLEAHLQTSQTEQKTLMEKYYASNSENEAQRRSLDEFRRRCDDSQSGLHELGRENQILRMELEKLLGRKWTEDSDVASCHLCQKEFSLLVRKHHCRNCGQIFCNECSSKNAAVANNKKPVRVCDGCYNELAAAM